MPARKAARPDRTEIDGLSPGPPRIRPPAGSSADDLGDLLQGSRGRDKDQVRGQIIRGLDHILDSPAEMHRVLKYKPGGFEHILTGFAEGMEGDKFRPIFSDGPCKDGLEARHLLLMILINLRVMPVLGGLAAMLGVDSRTASRYLGYGLTVCRRAVDSPEKVSARMMEMLRRGAYDELETEAPGLHLLIERTEIDRTELDGSHSTQQGMLVICTGQGRAMAVHAIPPDAVNPLEALARYAYGEGSFLRELTRPLPDGRRWSLIPGGCFRGGLEGFSRHGHRPARKEGRGAPEYSDAYDPGNMLQLITGLTNSYVGWEEAAGEVPWSPNAPQNRQ